MKAEGPSLLRVIKAIEKSYYFSKLVYLKELPMLLFDKIDKSNPKPYILNYSPIKCLNFQREVLRGTLINLFYPDCLFITMRDTKSGSSMVKLFILPFSYSNNIL